MIQLLIIYFEVLVLLLMLPFPAQLAVLELEAETISDFQIPAHARFVF